MHIHATVNDGFQRRKERERVHSAAETAEEKERRMKQQLEMEQDVLLKGSRRGR